MLGHRDHDNLDGGHGGRQHQAVVVAVGHDDGADQAGGHPPGGLEGVGQLVVPAGVLDVKSPGKPVPEEVGGARLEGLSVVHHGLDGVGGLGPGKLLLVGLAALQHRDGQVLLAQAGIGVQLLAGFGLGLLPGFVHGVAFLPIEFQRAEEGPGGLLPPADRAPLVVQLGQVPVGLDDVGIVLTEEGLGGGADTEPLAQFLAAAVGDPGHLGGQALHVVLLLLEEALGDEHGHGHVLVAGFLEHPVQNLLNVFPDGPSVGPDHHAAPHRRIIDQLGFLHHVGIPAGKVLVHGGDGVHHLFLFGHKSSSPIFPPGRSAGGGRRSPPQGGRRSPGWDAVFKEAYFFLIISVPAGIFNCSAARRRKENGTDIPLCRWLL